MSNLPIISGPSVEAASGITKSLVVLLHGYGANGDDLIGLTPPPVSYTHLTLPTKA